jgi:hypothetical protein
MSDLVKKEDVRNLQILKEDGSVWQGEIDEYGRVVLLHQIKPPTETPPEPSEEPEAAEAGTSPAEPETGTGEPEEASESIFDGIEPTRGSFESIEEIISKFTSHGTDNAKLPPRIDQPDEVKEIPRDVVEKLQDNAFRARLSSVMLDNKYDRKLKGRTRGKLDMTRLYKVPTNARSVFTQKQSRRGKQYNVLLLVDESGSMSGDKAERAAECAVFLAKQFEGININVAIVGFNAYITTRKEFTGKCDYNRVYEAIATMNWHKGAGSNNDWDALNKAYHMFAHAPEGENILIMMSDGYPASSNSNYNVDIRGEDEPQFANFKSISTSKKDTKEHLHHLVKANKNVTSIGIGILEGGWQIPNHTVIKNVDGLKKEVIKQLRTHIKRG